MPPDPIESEGVPVSGDLVEPPEATVRPSAATQNAAADRAVGRTTQQVGLPVAIVAILVWLARLKGVDLNPMDGQEEMPAEIVGAWIALATVLLARRMNPKTPD